MKDKITIQYVQLHYNIIYSTVFLEVSTLFSSICFLQEEILNFKVCSPEENHSQGILELLMILEQEQWFSRGFI